MESAIAMHHVQTLPGVFPLHEDRSYISESEWVIFKLLCKPLESLAVEDPQALSEATGGQVTVARCELLIRTTQIAQLPGLGSWISRLLAEAGFDKEAVCHQDAAELIAVINRKMGYRICNDATARALNALQLQWKGLAA